ncbi:MAG: hypothetical protein ABI955_04710, partial [Nitrospirota bacterium]
MGATSYGRSVSFDFLAGFGLIDFRGTTARDSRTSFEGFLVAMDLFANPAERDTVSPFVQLLWERGGAHEK